MKKLVAKVRQRTRGSECFIHPRKWSRDLTTARQAYTYERLINRCAKDFEGAIDVVSFRVFVTLDYSLTPSVDSDMSLLAA